MKNKSNILLLIIILIAVGVFVFVVSGVKIPYFENYGQNFRKNVKNITESLNINLPQSIEDFLAQTPKPLTTEEKLEIVEQMEKDNATPVPTLELPKEKDTELSASSKIIALKSAYSGEYISYKSKPVCVVDTKLIFFSNDGETEWAKDVQVSNPILKSAGDYLMIADKGGNRVYLLSGKKQKWETSVDEKIISADVSEKGDVVVVTDRQNYKGSVTVINRNGDVVFRWNSGKYEIIDSDIDSKSRKLAISLLNVDNGADSKISMFDLSDKEPFKSVDIADSLAFDIEFLNGTLNVVCDNKIIGINSRGKVIWTREFEDKSLYRYKIEQKGHKMMVFDNNNVAQINVLNSRGSVKSEFNIETFPEFAELDDGKLLYNDGRTLYFSDFSGKKLKNYKCTRDIYDLLIVDSSHLLAVYNSSVEFINVK